MGTITTTFAKDYKGVGRHLIRVVYRAPGRVFSASYPTTLNDDTAHLVAVGQFLRDFAGCYPETGMWDGTQTKSGVWTWKVEA